MAIVNIKNGTVERTFFEGKGAAVKETFNKRDGSEGAQYYSVFFDAPHGLSQGDQGDFSGLLGVKAEEYEGVWRAKIALNSARVQNIQSPGGGAAYDGDSPF